MSNVMPILRLSYSPAVLMCSNDLATLQVIVNFDTPDHFIVIYMLFVIGVKIRLVFQFIAFF